ncbi:hypothetical protein WJX84_001643 [Apatococcus fuscideae]|uniref:Beta-glucosidase n=1 Tax=Apatococcus fuscideae TaxID=2026836 RepID=A0AAW1TJ12_9CHLO
MQNLDNHDWHFLVGAALSVYQNAGGSNTNWSAFENKRTMFGQPFIHNNERCGEANGFWNSYEADIQRAKSLNSNCLRLSIEWGRIEPDQDKLDAAAIQRYHAIFDCIRRHGMEPVVTLYHFVHPLWFEHLGGFMQAANIQLFVAYAVAMYKEFGSKVKMWITFNEPGVQAFCGYIFGSFPPAHTLRPQLAGAHFCHMLRAHTAAYDAIKSCAGGRDVRVGIVHNYMNYAPITPAWSGHVAWACGWLNSFWGTQQILEYFSSGRFHFPVPCSSPVRHQETSKPGLDFIGINYYGRVLIDWKFKTVCHPGETMTDMPFPLYGKGLYEGIADLSKLGVPIYVTESGVADNHGRTDRSLRQKYLDTYLPEVERAVRDGLDCRGFMYWTLIDNFEWVNGFSIKFGLWEWNPGSQERIPLPQVQALAKIFAGWPAKMRQIRQASATS